MTGNALYVAALTGGYLLGSIPFGPALARVSGLGDLRKIGSGNIGATNVLRTGHKGLALATLLLDGGKGAAAVAAFLFMGHDAQEWRLAALIAGIAAVLGHNFPIWLKFKGGKGVATTLGVLLAAGWPIGIVTCLTWLLVAAVTRYSSLAALSALAMSPLYAYFLGSHSHATAAVVLALLGVVRHLENIARLRTGEESRIGSGKKNAEPKSENTEEAE